MRASGFFSIQSDDYKQRLVASSCRYAGWVLTLCLTLGLPACTTSVITPYVPPEPDYALPPAPDGVFSEIENYVREAQGADASGFELLDSNADALRWRLALIDSARHSIDVQYYLWYGDTAGRLFSARLLDAADRGVKVRILVDDLNTLLRTASSVVLRDEAVAWLDSHPNMDVRLFNPTLRRDFGGRVGEGMANFEKSNQRMHNKSLIVDNRGVIIGGRNIGDEYMGLNRDFNFHDLDVLGVGPVARQASNVFDAFWNSDWVVPVEALDVQITPEQKAVARDELLKDLSQSEALSQFQLESRDWIKEIEELRSRLHIGVSRVVSDLPDGDIIDHVMLEELRTLMTSTQQELLIVNAYIIPIEGSIAMLERLNEGGSTVKILTNSLASHDVPAVNSHYRPWRKPIVDSGAELYELRADAEIQAEICDTPPIRAQFAGLHTKAMVVDRERTYIGSMNFDPRSAALNTEMGVIIDSPDLGLALAAMIERDMAAANSWQVTVDADGKLQWAHDTECTDVQPARNMWQRIQELFFRTMPKEYY